MQIELENGLELLLRPVSQPALDELIDDLGGYTQQLRLAQMSTEELAAHFRALSPDKLERYNATQRRLMLYCFGFGVVTEPPDDAAPLLQYLSVDSDIPQIRRAHWLLYVAGITRTDKSSIVGNVMALTRISDGR